MSAVTNEQLRQLIERGYLVPFGHPATVTRVSEREFRADEAGGSTAAVVQSDHLAVAVPSLVA